MSTNTSSCRDFHPMESLTSQSPSMWKCHTKLERALCFTTALLLILFVVLIMVFTIPKSFYQRHSAGDYCLTPGCVKTAAEILMKIDESVEPCTDFYQFACGKWQERHIIPEEKSVLDSYSISDDFQELVKDFLEKPVEVSDPPYVKKIKNFYSSCMNLDAIEKAGDEPLKSVLTVLGGWPVVEGKKWNENKFDWIETLVSLKNFGYSHKTLFSLKIYVDSLNSSAYKIQLEKPSLSVPLRGYWIELGLNDTTTAAYYKKMIEAAKYLGAHESVIENELLEALHFEMSLAEYSEKLYEYEENVTSWACVYTVEELQNFVPQIPWLKYISNLLGTEIYENDDLEVCVLGFLMDFAALVTTTDKRVIANYMLWRVVEESLPFLSKEWRDIDLRYQKVIMGKNREKPRHLQCVSLQREFTSDDPLKISTAFSAYYYRHHFDEEKNNHVSEIAKYIHEEFLSMLDENKWLDEGTKDRAKSKANILQYLIGYPDELLNDTFVTEYLQALTITNESYYRNIFEIKKWSTEIEFSKLRKHHIKGEWNTYAKTELSPIFEYSDNIIFVPPGVLQSPFYYKDSLYYLNFGAIGAVIGHEITHGFDNIGRNYDEYGEIDAWWEPDSNEQFQEKAKCIIDQYSNYTIGGLKIDGSKGLNQNIADNGGLKAAYLAYISWVEDNSPEQLLPGLNYDQKQLFWISNAHVYCEKIRPEMIKFFAFSGFTANKFRVIGPMSNLEEFSKDFNCPPNSPMNKQPKCQIW